MEPTVVDRVKHELYEVFWPIIDYVLLLKSVFVYILVKCGIMECEHFMQLQKMLELDPGGRLIPQYLKKMFEESPPKVAKRGVALTLRKNQLRPNNDIMEILSDNMPPSYRTERYLILRCIPLPVTLHPSLCDAVADHVADILMEDREGGFQLARDNLGELLMQIPELILRHDDTPLCEAFSDKDRIAVLYYIEEFVKPILDKEGMRLSNRMYSQLARNLPTPAFNQFFKCVMESDNYSYHNLLAAFADRALTMGMPVDLTMNFMKAKHNGSTTRGCFGNITYPVADRIEFNLINEVIKTAGREEMDQMLNDLRYGILVRTETLQKIASRHYFRLKRDYTPLEMTLSQRLWNLSSRAVLTRYGRLIEKRHEILSETLQLENQYNNMSAMQKTIFFAVLASQSFPKVVCKETGSDTLFKLLITRLLEILPPKGAPRWIIDLNEYANILYCLYNLYRINHRLKRLIRGILPEWRSPLVTMLDLQIMTSENVAYAMSNEQNAEEKLKLSRVHHILIVAGKLLAYLFGNIDEEQLFIVPHYWALEPKFRDVLFTDSFTTEFTAVLKMQQTCPGRVKLLGKNQFELIERLGAINDELEDTEDEDDSEDEGVEDNDVDDEEEEEEESDEEDSSDDDFSEGELNGEFDESDESDENAEDADDEVSGDEDASDHEGASSGMSCVVATNFLIHESQLVRNRFVDALFVDQPEDYDDFPEDTSHLPAVAPEFLPPPPIEENPEPYSQQWWRNYYGIPNGFTAEVMERDKDLPVVLDPNMPVEGAADPKDWGNLDNPDERRFLLGDMADVFKI